MICDAGCDCAFQSNSLAISNNGGVISIESNFLGIVTSATRPGSPFTGQHIWETDTGRGLAYDGTSWIIQYGTWPQWHVERQSILTVNNASSTDVTFPTEIVDTDAFHTGTANSITIPSGLGGDWEIGCRMNYAASAAGYRAIFMTITSNTTTAPTQNSTLRWGAMPDNTANNGYGGASSITLEAGATVAVTTFHTAGSAIDLNAAEFWGRMIRHRPTLT